MNMWHRIDQGTQRAAFAISASLVGISLFAGSIANAALLPLAPGGSINFASTPAPASLPTGPMVGSETFPLTDIAGAPLTGTLTSEVFDDTPTSTSLDFVYLLSNTGNVNTGDSFDGLSLVPFFNFTTNVGYVAGGVDPSSSDRAANGQTIDWGFTTTTIGPGQSSDFLVIQTNATQFSQGSANIIDGGTAQTGAEAPFLMVGVPEPTSIGLVVLAGGMLLGRRRRA